MSNWPPSEFPLPPVPRGPVPEAPVPPVVPRPRVGIRAVTVWIVIVAAAGVMIEQNANFRSVAQTTTRSSDLQLDLVSRYAVGCKLLFDGTSLLTSANVSDLAAQVRAKATTPYEHLMIIPVIAELQGNAAGADEAAALLREHPDPSVARDANALRRVYSGRPAHLSIATAQRLEDHLGWYGQLAVSQVGRDPQAVRPRVTALAKRTAITILSALGLAAPLLIAGIVLFVLFVVYWSVGKLPPRYAPGDPAAADMLAEAFALYLSGMVALIVFSRYLPRRLGAGWNVLLVAPVLLAIIWARIRGLRFAQLGKAVGWNRGRGIGREMLAGFLGYLAGTPLILVSTFIFAFLQRFTGTPPAHPIEFDIETGGWERVAIYFLACVFAPVAEELMFRGMLLRHLTARMSWFVSAIIASLIFAAIHPQGWTAIPVLATIGMVLAMIRIQRDTLVASMRAHALNNFLIITLLVVAVG